LLSTRRGGVKEAPNGTNVALEREIFRPHILRSGTSSDNAFGLCDIDCMQLEA
jgi:hypothetical protein